MSESFAFLRDGGQLLIRPYGHGDRAALSDLLYRLSPESLMRRLHSGGLQVDAHSIELLAAGHSLLGLIEDRVVALTSYVRLRDPERAEMAIVVDDAHQGRGVGTAMFERLARDAWQEGIRRFLALVIASNVRMMEMLRSLGFRLTRTVGSGEVEVEVELSPDPAFLATSDARMHVAAAASLRPLFEPRAIAVVGPSRKRGTIGHEVMRNLLDGGFRGPVYPVHPEATSVASVRAYPTVAEIPDKVDLAIIVVPAAHVLDVARDALLHGARARRDLGRLRGGGRRREKAAGRAPRALPRPRRTSRGAELHGNPRERSRGGHRRDVQPGEAALRIRVRRVPVRRARCPREARAAVARNP